MNFARNHGVFRAISGPNFKRNYAAANHRADMKTGGTKDPEIKKNFEKYHKMLKELNEADQPTPSTKPRFSNYPKKAFSKDEEFTQQSKEGRPRELVRQSQQTKLVNRAGKELGIRNTAIDMSHDVEVDESTGDEEGSSQQAEVIKIDEAGLIQKYGRHRGEEIIRHLKRKQKLKEQGLDSWNPVTKLNRSQMEELRAMRKQNPKISTQALATKFKISIEAVERILESKWQPSPERSKEQDAQKEELTSRQIMDSIGSDIQTLNKVFAMLTSFPHDIDGLQHLITVSRSVSRQAYVLQEKEFHKKYEERVAVKAKQQEEEGEE